MLYTIFELCLLVGWFNVGSCFVCALLIWVGNSFYVGVIVMFGLIEFDYVELVMFVCL